MTIQLSPDLEQALAEEAVRLGTTPDSLANQCLRERFAPESSQPKDSNAKNLAERLKDHIGVLRSSEYVPGGAQMSENTGKQFTDILLQQRQRGRK